MSLGTTALIGAICFVCGIVFGIRIEVWAQSLEAEEDL
jgi:hypothetical protein